MASWGTRKAIVTSYTWTSLSSVGSLVAHATVDPGRLCNTSLLSACGVVRETAEMAGKGGGKARGAYFKVLTQKAVEAALAQGLETQEKLVVWLVLNFVLQP